MLAFGAIVLSILLAYRAMSVGLLTVLSQCIVGVVAIAVGAGLAGGLRNAIPAQFAGLQGWCFIAISLGVYLLMRMGIMYYMLERDVPLPGAFDRLGGGLCGFFGGLMLCGYACMVVLVFMPSERTPFVEELRSTAQYGVAPVRLVGTFASTEQETGMRILLDNILFKTPTISNPNATKKQNANPSRPKPTPSTPTEPLEN